MEKASSNLTPGWTTIYPNSIWTIDQIFSIPECQAWINLAEAIGFSPAGVEGPVGYVIDRSIRNNSRIEIEQPQCQLLLWSRIAEDIPPIQALVPAGLFPKLRFYRYLTGERFNLHADGHKLGKPGEKAN